MERAWLGLATTRGSTWSTVSATLQYDLADDADLLLMYERVVREAQTSADLRAHLDADLVRRHWTDLFLPTPARAAWQTRFPELAPAAAAA